MLDDILNTLIKALISVFVLFILARLMGKKQVSQLTFFDYVAGISIGSIAASFAVDPSISYAKGITGLVVYATFPILLSYISLKSYRARRILDGKPTLLIKNGRMIEKNIKRTKLTVNDVLEECRLKNAFDIADVEFAMLETNGQVSVQMKPESKPVTPKDMGIKAEYAGLCINIIIDGEIIEEHLESTGKTKEWLLDELAERNVSCKEILLGYIDGRGRLCIHKKN